MSKSDNLVNSKSRLVDLEKFISAVKSNPSVNKKDIFLDIFNFKEDELEMMLFFGMAKFDNDIDSLERQLTKMRRLNYENDIKDELEALQKQYSTNSPVMFELFILDENDDFGKTKLGGVSAFIDNGKMSFIVLPEESVRQALKSAVTHEFHHHWRISALKIDDDNQTLLDRLVLEGLAEHFVRLQLGEEYLGPFSKALSETQAKKLWETTFKQQIKIKGERTDPYMFGDKEKDIPHWAGYSLGYFLVKWYLDKSEDISIEKLSLLPSEAFLY